MRATDGRRTEWERRRGNGAERTQFLGQLGLVIGGVNFLLIALEGLYAVLLEARRCG